MRSVSAPVAFGSSRSRPGESHCTATHALRLPDGRVLCARRCPGTGERTLVALHGLLDSSEGFSCLGERLTCPQVAFDLPGFGCSDLSTPGSIAGYASDVADGLRLLGVERFTLVGHSLGGAVATALAELLPDRIDALVLLAPAGFGRIGLAEAVSKPGVRQLLEVTLPLMLSNERFVSAAYQRIVSNHQMPAGGIVDRVTSRGGELAAGTREGTRAVVQAGRARDAFHHRRVRYRGPVDVVWGDRDRLVPPSHRHGVRKALPQARIHLWHGIGHDPLRECFDEVSGLITQSLGGAPPTRRPRRAKPTARRLSYATA
ncbi:MAG: alpha/beta fold hydrolase [Solirubrobacteraceae bacterium]